MPNPLRKIRQHLFTENKISKFLVYVIAEIILVVTGILLAVQVNNWNEDRIARKEEQILLKGLKNEMEDNLAQVKEVIAYSKRSKEAAYKLLGVYISDYRQFKLHEVDSMFAEVQWAWTFDPRLGILNSIKVNGKIGVIQNPDIQEFITSFEETAEDAGEESLLLRSLIVERYTLSISKYIGLGVRTKYIGFDIRESKFPSNYEGIFNDREIESLLAYIYIWRENELDELNTLHNMLQENIAIVENDILKH